MPCKYHNELYVSLTDFYDSLKIIGEQLLRVNKKDWNEKKYKNRALGYGNLCRMTITEANIPSSTITALWLGGNIKFGDKTLNWKELFPRRTKVLPNKNKIVTNYKEPTLDTNKVFSQLNDFIIDNYLKRNLIALNYYEESIDYYSNYFKTIIKIDSKNTTILKDNIFENLSNHVLKSNSDNPLVISGLPGCGKSAFLSIMYLTLKRKYENNEISKIPIYINLHKYNKEIYTNLTDSFQIQAREKLNSDLQILFNILSKDDKNFLIIIDGTDQYLHSKVDIELYLYEKLKSISSKTKIIGVRQYVDEEIRSYKKSTPIPFIEDPEIEIELVKKGIEEDDFLTLIENFSQVESLIIRQSVDETKNYLIEKLKKYKIEKIDAFVLNLLMKGITSRKYNNTNTLSSFYLRHFENSNIDLSESSIIAFKLYNDPSSINHSDKNNLSWWNILRHKSFLNFFVANNIVDKLIDSNENNAEVFNFVYPFEINKFCKEIINHSVNYQNSCFKQIINIFDDLKITSKTHFAYLLGRFQAEHLKNKSIEFLWKKLEELSEENHLPESNNSNRKLNKNEKKLLLYQRTLFISLTYLGDKKASSDYIQILVNNNYHDNLNRGFHLEYYNDIIFESSSPENLKNEDSLKDFDNTFNKLFPRLLNAINTNIIYPMFQIELYTLCSLAQHRDILNLVTSDRKEKIINLVSETLSKDLKFENEENNELLKYLDFIKRVLSDKRKLKSGTFLLDLYKIKSLPRSGWLTKKRGILNPESVASHMYGTYLIGYFFLPNELPNEVSYDKNRILNILLSHDLVEAYTGDIISTIKTDEDRRIEREYFTFLSFLGTYKNVANVRELEEFHNEFQNSTSINGKIAKDIDKLELLLQLHLYKKDFPNKIEDFTDFKRKLTISIKTKIGIKIKNIILNLFNN